VFVFSAACPIMALVTHAMLKMFGDEDLRAQTAALLLFSAGTFLNVATSHSVQGEAKHSHRSMGSIGLVVVGILIPATIAHWV